MTFACMQRPDFPMLQKKVGNFPLIYFDNAATTQKPQCVIDALSDFYTNAYGTVHRGVYSLSREATERYTEARRTVQSFIHAACPEEIIFTRGTTDALNLLARSFSAHFLSPNDVILITEIEHHSNIVPWQMVCQERGAELRVVPVNDAGDIEIEVFEKYLDSRVKLVSIAHLSHVLGTLHPVKTLIEAAHKAGAYVCLDGAQACPHLAVDVGQLDVDFYCFSGHKLYGPTGIGVLYGKQELLEKLPPVQGGGDMVNEVFFDKTSYGELPVKFEAGTPMIAEAIGLKAALDYLNTVGMEEIFHWEQELHDTALLKLRALEGVQLIGDPKNKGAIISFVIEGIHPLDLAMFLDCRGVALRSGHLCSQPALRRFGHSSVCRISFGLYNTLEEIDLFIDHLTKIQSKLYN